MIKRIKERLYEILEVAAIGDIPSKVFDIFIMALITLNVITVILTTVERLDFQYQYYFRIFEIFSVTVFSLEYLLRLWTCTFNENFRSPITGRMKYMLTPFALRFTSHLAFLFTHDYSFRFEIYQGGTSFSTLSLI